MEIGAFLKQTPLFSSLTDDEIATVLATAKQRTFPAGKQIIRAGHEGGAGFYLVLEGNAEVTKDGVHLADHGPGSFFGEMALLLEDTPRTADVTATEPTTCLIITKWDLKSTLTTHPDIGVKIMGELAKRLRDTNEALSD